MLKVTRLSCSYPQNKVSPVACVLGQCSLYLLQKSVQMQWANKYRKDQDNLNRFPKFPGYFINPCPSLENSVDPVDQDCVVLLCF